MNLKSVAAAAAVLVAGSTGAAFAQTTAPVAIVSSHAEPQIADAVYNQSGIATVTFVNNNSVPATEVDFTLSSNGSKLAMLRDVGSFAPNVAISHTFANDHVARDQQLSIAKVTFADGSVWVNDAPLPAGQLAVHDWMTTGF